ncbi:hypothetical protein PG911_08920 [Tenacibaculum ovolyticum]|nr:hypothetical protein [Tenacibaculum ovolyticum]WBX78368.1 hypothetical protein PG911_08920 [Tenacibaculum ovolyticum]
MNTLIIVLTAFVSVIGIVISIKTIIETRKKYYKDYLKRKRNEKA